MPLLGHLALWVALLAGVWGAAMGLAADRLGRVDVAESARRAGTALAMALIVALMALVVALLRQNFNVAYVAAFTDRALPQVYRLAALYAGPEGQLLLWTTLVALFGAVARARPAFAGAIAAIVSVAVVILLLVENPFGRLDYTPIDGRGLGADLQDVGFLVVPPLLGLGYAVAAVLAGFAVSSWLGKRIEPATRWWVLVAWIIMTLGIGAGLWWAYRRSGFDGTWVGDPVRSQSLAVWLLLSALVVGTRAASADRVWKLNSVVMLFTAAFAVWAMFERGRFGVAVALSLAGLLWFAQRVHAMWPERWRHWAMGLALAGVLVAGLGLAFQRLATRTEQTLRPGETVTVPGWNGLGFAVAYVAASHYPVANAVVTRALLDVRRGSGLVGRLAPERRQFVNIFGRENFEPVGRADIVARPLENVYAVLVAVSERDDAAVLQVAIHPLVWLVWVGILTCAAAGIAVLVEEGFRP
jgi:cytochrome c biogenesis factor